ncbi:hypothetical protein [Methylorubrum salsuginis]|uniref:hypothetical protein n=1 Tax=Methylorubrum salsuginis TaxID=414703 RepID=UPI003CC7A975
MAARAAAFANSFGWAETARAAGLLHDIGKASAEVQPICAARGRTATIPSPGHGWARRSTRLCSGG